MSPVPKRHAIRLESRCQAQDLMTHTDPKDRFVPFVDGLAHAHGGIHDHLGISRPIGQEKPVELVTDRIKVVIPRKHGHNCAPTHERAKNVCLESEIEYGNTGPITIRVQSERFWCGCLSHEIVLARVPVLVVPRSRRVHITSYDQTSERRALISKQARDGARINPGDTRHVVPRTPLVEGFHGLIMRVLERDIRHDNASALNSVGFQVRQTRKGVGDVGRNTVVADHWGGEDEDLTEIGRICHRVGICISPQRRVERRQRENIVRDRSGCTTKAMVHSAHHPARLFSPDSQLVILVLNTVSPYLLFALPKLCPTKLCPDLRWSAAGILAGRTGLNREGLTVAKARFTTPDSRREGPMIDMVRIWSTLVKVLGRYVFSVIPKGEDEVGEIAAEVGSQFSRLQSIPRPTYSSEVRCSQSIEPLAGCENRLNANWKTERLIRTKIGGKDNLAGDFVGLG